MSNTTEQKNLYVEENTVRLVAAQVVVLAFITLISGWPYLALVLAIDFATRAFTGYPSLLATIARSIAAQLKLQPVRIFAAPKKFAAAIGTLFSLAVFALIYFQLYTAAYVVGGVLAFFALLESAFKICVGCYVYDWVVKPFTKS